MGATSIIRAAHRSYLNQPAERWVSDVLLLALSLTTFYYWMQFPALPANDDALFLSRGVGHFSVIEFSPHFPGYAGLVLFVKSLRWLFSSDYHALHVVVLGMTVMIPIVVYWVLIQLQVARFISLACAVVLYFQPLLISVALSGLSDGPGLLIWLLALLLLLKGHVVGAALLSGIMLTVRPSYLLLLLPLIGFLIWQNRHQLNRILWAIALPSLLSLLYMYSKDGIALFGEAFRFIRGHFFVWGNTGFIDSAGASWWQVASEYLGGDGLLIVLSTLLPLGCVIVWIRCRAARCLMVSFVFILLWTFFFQNQNNLRHLLPVIVLGGMILTVAAAHVIGAYRGGRLALAAALVAYTSVQIEALPKTDTFLPQPPAFQQALIWLNTQTGKGRYERVLVTNEGVEVARAYQSKRRVADAWYQQQAEWLWMEGAWRMSYTPIELYGQPVIVFPRRFAGEHSAYLYRLNHNGVSDVIL